MNKQETWTDRRILVQKVEINEDNKTVKLTEAYCASGLSELIEKNENDDAEIKDVEGDMITLYDGRTYRITR